MRAVPLTAVKGGISRLRTKGAAPPQSLYDLLNGYVTAARTVKVRPGTVRHAELPTATRGLTAFQGLLHVFSTSVVSVPAGFINHVLTHPNATPDAPTPDDYELKEIHFAEPFLGFLYVVAEFGNGDVYHFWLQSGGAWQANKTYKHGDIVEPGTPNGLAYQATRLGSPLPSWAPNVPRAVGDRIEPTQYNDFLYEVVDTIGAAPASGALEPDWPTTEGARVFEDSLLGSAVPPTTPTTPSGAQKPTSGVTDRYT